MSSHLCGASLEGRRPRRATAWLGAVWLLGASGCAPSLPTLVHDRHYDEALCATALRAGTPERDRVFVAAGLARDAAPSVHVHAVTAEELRAAVGSKGERLARELVILRTLVDTNRLSSVDFRFTLALHDGRSYLKEHSLSREVLAARVGERVPPSRTVTVQRGGLRLRKIDVWLLFAGLAEGATLGIVPVTRLTGHVVRAPTITRTLPPSDAEFRKAAPAAEMLYRSLAAEPRAGDRSYPPAQDVSLWERPAGAAHPSLHIRWRYETSCRGTTARLEQQLVLPLPPGPTLEARVNALFGDRMRSLSELAALARAPGPGPGVPHPSPQRSTP